MSRTPVPLLPGESPRDTSRADRHLRRRLLAAVAFVGALSAFATVPAVAATTSPATSPATSQAPRPTPVGVLSVAPNHHVAPPTRLHAQTAGGSGNVSYSGNWSGYAQTGSGYSSVSATWVVPTVNAPSPNTATTASSTWVGVDGDNNSSLIQTGTAQRWNGSSRSASYYAWWEILPANETFAFSVSPGDNISASIKRLSNGQWFINLKDLNSGKTITQTQNYSGPRTSVEWIHEAPSLSGSTQTLASTGPVTFTNARVNGFSPSLQGSQAIEMTQGGWQVSTASNPNEAANGFTVADGSSTPAAAITPVYQRHSDGSIWASTNAACTTTSCAGWYPLDGNTADVQIVAGAGSVFQRHSDGSIWESTGAACGSGCAGWVQLDNNPHTILIVAGAGSVWQLHSDGSIWRSTGEPCNGTSCPGWVELDNNPRTGAIAAGAGTLFQRHGDGSIWRWTGAACSSTGCPGWTPLDNNTATKFISANASTVYQMHSDGSVWRSTGAACSSTGCPGWTLLDNNGATTAISAGGSTVYELRNDGSIWRSTGAACTGSLCSGWTKLDSNPAARAIVASSNTVFQLHSDGSIWRSTGAACSASGCGGWSPLDGNTHTVGITVSNGG